MAVRGVKKRCGEAGCEKKVRVASCGVLRQEHFPTPSGWHDCRKRATPSLSEVFQVDGVNLKNRTAGKKEILPCGQDDRHPMGKELWLRDLSRRLAVAIQQPLVAKR